MAIKNKGCYIYGSVYVSGNTIQFWKFIVLAPIPKQSYKCQKCGMYVLYVIMGALAV